MEGRLPPFRPGGEFTLGAEEELQLVAPDGAPSEPDDIVARVADLRPPGTVSPEISGALIEFGTPVCKDAGEVAACLAAGRLALRKVGQAAIGVGVHPAAAFGEFHSVHTQRYDRISEELHGFLRTSTASFQVHVGMPDTETLIAAYRAVRNHLPLLRGLAADSPFWHGRDSGLADARGAIQRSYPRIGTPPAFRSYAEYESYTAQAIAAAEIPDYTYLWWDLRPHPYWGTLEVRVMDAQCSLDRAAGLAALVHGIARHAAASPPTVDLPAVVLDENDFRAVRYGLDARLVDGQGVIRPLRDIAAEVIARARAVLAPEGLADPLEWLRADLDREAECQRQRRVYEAGGMPALLTDLMVHTVGAAVEADRRQEQDARR